MSEPNRLEKSFLPQGTGGRAIVGAPEGGDGTEASNPRIDSAMKGKYCVCWERRLRQSDRMQVKTVAIIGTRGYPSYYGGFETAVRKVAPYLAEKGWDVTVYGRPGATLDSDPTCDPRVRAVRTRGLERKSISTLSYGLTATWHALFHKPDVALVMNVANGYYLPLLRARGVKTIVNVDGIEWDRAKWGRVAKAVFRGGARATARYADELICDSLEIVRRWSNDFERAGIFIPYGGDAIGALPVQPGLTHRGYVLAVARFVPENTIPEFVESAARIAETIPVVIVGSSGYGGPLEAEVARLAESNARVTWLGHISDDQRLLSLWQHAAVYFHGHSVGGTNPTLVQAMAMGTPVVARDTVYNREVLGDGGVFCAPDSDSIGTAVIQLAKDPTEQERISRVNFARSRDRYTWEAVCAAYDRALSELAEKGRQSAHSV